MASKPKIDYKKNTVLLARGLTLVICKIEVNHSIGLTCGLVEWVALSNLRSES